MNKKFVVRSSVFHVQKANDDNVITDAMLKHARKSGKLNLSNRHLVEWSEKIFNLGVVHSETDDIDLGEKKCGDSFKWWEIEPLNYLDLSSNTLKSIPPEIKELHSLKTLLLHQNLIEVLPQELALLNNLIKLDLAHNKISEFPLCLSKLKELRSLNLSDNLFKVFPEAVFDLVMLNKLDISKNLIEEISPGIGFLTRLDSLNLSHNKLVSIPPDLTNCRALKELNLSNNKITSEGLPDLVDMNVEIIHLHYNEISSLPKLRGCHNLKEIHLGFNKIEFYNPVKSQMITNVIIRELNIIQNSNQFCNNGFCFVFKKILIPEDADEELTIDELSTLSHLQIVILRNNHLKKLPKEMTCLQNMIRLDLSYNDLTELPATLSLLPHLENLLVEGNSLRTIRRDILQGGTSRLLAYLKQLLTNEDVEKNYGSRFPCAAEQDFPDRFAMRSSRAVTLSSKDLCNVPDSVFEEAVSVPCNIVDLSKNKLQQVPEGVWRLSRSLNDLNLGQNQLKHIPIEIGNCLNLRYLNVASNHLNTLPVEFVQCNRMRELNISFNKFQEIPCCIYGLHALEILNMADNKITSMDANKFLEMKFLTHLDLSNNCLTSVPPLMGKMTQLQTFKLDGNGLRALRPAILAKGTEAVLSWLRNKIV